MQGNDKFQVNIGDLALDIINKDGVCSLTGLDKSVLDCSQFPDVKIEAHTNALELLGKIGLKNIPDCLHSMLSKDLYVLIHVNVVNTSYKVSAGLKADMNLDLAFVRAFTLDNF